MSGGGQDVNCPSGDRKIGFEVTKEIFMINAMSKPIQLQGPGPRRVFTLESYVDKQTELCASMAVASLNQTKINFTVDEAIRSNCILGCKVDKEDHKLYFHANFLAKSESDEKRYMFFSEIQGSNRPEDLNCCIDVTDDGVFGNCRFCTGVKHPKDGDFVGKIHPVEQNL